MRTISCSRFYRILADFEEGTLHAGEQSAVKEHLRKCSACRELLDVARGQADIFPAHARMNFTRSVLDRTSGPTCPRVESSLWELGGSELDPESSELMFLHLEQCPECRSLAGDFELLRQVLPAMAEVEPDESFARDVFAATSGMRRFRSDFVARLQTWWNRMVQRPLFSYEAAYVATLLLLFAVSSLSPVREAAIRKIPSVWSSAKAPAEEQVHRLASWSHQELTKSVCKLTESTEQIVSSTMGRGVQDFKSWRTGGAANLAVFWQRFSHSLLPK